MSNAVLLTFLAKNFPFIYVTVEHIMFNLNSRFTERTWTHHHSARLKLYFLFKITSLYVADYNMDFTIGLLLVIDETSDKVYVRLPLVLWVDDEDGPVCGAARGQDKSLFNSQTVEGTAFGFYLMHNANVQWSLRFCSPLYNKLFSPFSPVQPSLRAKLTARLDLFYF